MKRLLMRKTWFVILLTCVLTLPVVAQVRWGVRVGNAYSTLVYKLDDVADSGSRFGYSFAGLVDIPVFWQEFSVRPEISFVSHGGSFYNNMEGELLKSKYHYYSLQVPVNFCYTFKFSEVGVSLFGGPVADFPLFGKKKFRGEKEDINFGSGKDDDIKAFDLAVSVGLGVEYTNFMFSVNAICGTFNRRPEKLEGETSVYQNNIVLSLGYFFRPRR